MPSLVGKTVFITGASRGIGAALAQRVHRLGANVALAGLEGDLLRSNAHELGERAEFYEVDVTDLESLTTAASAVRARFGSIDVAVANAGIAFPGALATSPVAQVERTLEVNLMGVWRTNRAVVPYLTESGGYLINVTSLAAIVHTPLMGAYTASKAGAEALTDALRVELRPARVAVGCAYYGFVDTDLVRGANADPVGRAALGLGPAMFRRSMSVEAAVDALEGAIGRRAARVWAPRFVGPAMAARGIVQPISERLAGLRSRELRRALTLASQYSAEARQQGILGLAGNEIGASIENNGSIGAR